MRIPRSQPISVAVLDAASTNWALDSVSYPLNFVPTYSGPLPKGTMSSDALFRFTTINPTRLRLSG